MAPKTSEIVSTGERMIPDSVWTDGVGEWRWVDTVDYAWAGHRPERILRSSFFAFLRVYQALRVTEGDTVVHSLVNQFLSRITGLSEVERVFWKVEHDRIHVWTVMDRPNLGIENEIYDAQLDLMDLSPETSFDFVVIFRQGKNSDQVSPEGAAEVFVRK